MVTKSTGKAPHQPSLSMGIPPGTKTFRTTLSLPADLAVGLSTLAKRLSITQSALVAALLSQAIPDLQKLIDTIPENPDQDAVRRFRGESIDYVMTAVATALKDMDG